jgi:leucyl/phenylalanyl-tRNA---protein transferase
MTPLPAPTPQFLLEAYRQGCFPMAPSRCSREPLGWYTPVRRGIIPLEGFHLPRRLMNRLRSDRFRITSNVAFEEVIRGCAEPRPSEPDTWINDDIISLYTQVHRLGHVHSIEAWLPDSGELVGGIYGVHTGAVFSAESKFCRPAAGGTDASKVCLAHLLLHLRRRGFAVLDAQMWNPHLAQFGCLEIRRTEYNGILRKFGNMPVAWDPFDPAANLELLKTL